MDFSPKMWREIPSVIHYHYKNGNINYFMTIFHMFLHTFALIGFASVHKAMPETLIFSVVLAWLSGLGITVGAHRLWCHRSFEAHISVRIVLMLLNSIANQTPLYHWCKDHRVHHKHSETNADPHNATRGFFFAHVGWLYLKKEKDVVAAGKQMDFSDLWDDPVVRFQHYLDPVWNQIMCFVVPALICVYGWGEHWWWGFLHAGVCRYTFSKHCTFLVNSAAHLYGDHPYDVNSYPAENPIVAFLAIGEGWHNFHHMYPYDYATSEFGILSQNNPSKLVIDILAALGLVWGRKRATAAWARGRERRDRDAANGIRVKKQPPRPWELHEEKKME